MAAGSLALICAATSGLEGVTTDAIGALTSQSGTKGVARLSQRKTRPQGG